MPKKAKALQRPPRRPATTPGKGTGKRGRRANSKPSNGFTKRFTGGPRAHGESVQRARELDLISDRAVKAFDLMIDGKDFREIGRLLGVSAFTAHTDCMTVKNAMPTVLGVEGVELLKTRALRRSDRIWAANCHHLHIPARAAIAMRAIEFEARVAGIYAQPPTGLDEGQVAAVFRAMRMDFLTEFADAAVRLKIAEIFHRRALAITGPVIDQVPAGEAQQPVSEGSEP